jgi:hypothetical protein
VIIVTPITIFTPNYQMHEDYLELSLSPIQYQAI